MFSCVVLGVWLHDCSAGCCVCGVSLCGVGVAAFCVLSYVFVLGALVLRFFLCAALCLGLRVPCVRCLFLVCLCCWVWFVLLLVVSVLLV